MPDTYDVVIVGGRIAGASLALRLSAAGLRAVVVDQSSFPSRPAVSAPFLLPHAMELLDELGLQEQEYANNTPALRSFVLEFANYFRSQLRFEERVAGRDYFYAIDRAKLDGCLWRALEQQPSLAAYSGARLHEIKALASGYSVSFSADGCEHVVHTRALVGADGRYSRVAATVGAQTLHERKDCETTLYYAHFRNVAAYEPGVQDVAHIHTSCDGFSFVFMPSAQGETMVVAQGRSDLYLAQPGTAEEVYARLLRERPLVQRRLHAAEQVTQLAGVKHMGNMFRQPYGAGWALVGDAYHQKDSLDAQGIYDALLGSKLLAAALIAWHAGEAWDAALSGYASSAWSAFKPMFDATMERVKREIYTIPPPLVARSLLRYVLTHEAYAQRFARVATRRLEPAQLLPPSTLLRLAAEGAWRRGRRKLLQRHVFDPTDPIRTL